MPANRVKSWLSAVCIGSALCVPFQGTSFGDESGLNTVVAADLVGQFDLSESEASDRFDIRGVELGLYGPIDHTFDGKFSIAAHPSSEGLGVEVHEVVLSASRLNIPVQIKVGQFFLGVGRLNQIHQHDWSFTSTPLIHELVFDSSEGAFDTGAEIAWLAPWLPATEITLGVTNGWTFGHSHTKGTKPREPLLYVRSTLFGDADTLGFQNSSSGLLLGVSWVRRRPDRSSDPEFDLFGADLTLKLREANHILWLWQTEGWYRELKPTEGEFEKVWGAYSFLERHTWDRLFAGARIEILSDLSRQNLLGEVETNDTWVAGPVLTWRHSEFQLFRMEYLFERAQVNETVSDAHRLSLQTSFILGAHPAHDF